MKNHVLKHIRDLLFMKPERRDGDLCVEKPKSLPSAKFHQAGTNVLCRPCCPPAPRTVRLDPHGVMQVAAVFLNDGIYPEKSKTGHLAQFKGTLFQDVHAGGSEVLINRYTYRAVLA